MANHTITIVNSNVAAPSASQGPVANNQVQNKPTSAQKQFMSNKQGSPTKSVLKWVNIAKNINVSGAISMMGGGAAMAMATIKTSASVAQSGVNIYASYQEAKTGEKIKYDNMRAIANYIVNPMSYVKQSIWDYGVIRNMELKRENETLNYQRQLTGNVIYAKNYNNGSF